MAPGGLVPALGGLKNVARLVFSWNLIPLPRWGYFRKTAGDTSATRQLLKRRWAGLTLIFRVSEAIFSDRNKDHRWHLYILQETRGICAWRRRKYFIVGAAAIAPEGDARIASASLYRTAFVALRHVFPGPNMRQQKRR